MNLLELFQRDARPDVTVSIAEIGIPVKDKVYLVTGQGYADAVKIAQLVPKLAYGSVALVYLFPKEQYKAFDAKITPMHMCAWDKFGGDEARAWVKSYYDGGTYASHKACLMEAIKRTTGPILELGAGEGSTPVLHEVCSKAGRLVVTVDNSADWLKKYKALTSPHHQFEHNPDPATTQHLAPEKQWGVIFVDHAPGETRAAAINRARTQAEYVVVHDTEELGYGMEDALKAFKYRRDFRYSRPWTTVASDKKEIW